MKKNKCFNATLVQPYCIIRHVVLTSNGKADAILQFIKQKTMKPYMRQGSSQEDTTHISRHIKREGSDTSFECMYRYTVGHLNRTG